MLCVALSQSPERREHGARYRATSADSVSLVLAVDGLSSHPTTTVGGNLESAIAKDFSTLREVNSVLTESAEESLLVWIGVDAPTTDVRNRIFDKQISLIEGFPEVEFDFNIIAASAGRPDEIASRARVIYSRGAM